MQLTDNFNIREFYCNDGTRIPQEYIANVIELAENLQVLRDYAGAAIRVNSGYRHRDYNTRIGGAKNSQHLYACAADIIVDGMTPQEVADLIEELIAQGKMKEGGLGRYNTFTHYDIRGYNSRWSRLT